MQLWRIDRDCSGEHKEEVISRLPRLVQRLALRTCVKAARRGRRGEIRLLRWGGYYRCSNDLEAMRDRSAGLGRRDSVEATRSAHSGAGGHRY